MHRQLVKEFRLLHCAYVAFSIFANDEREET
jgi:hypothetical protein